jgi:hypothetical protein
MGNLPDQTENRKRDPRENPKQEKYRSLAELRRGVRRVRRVTPGERNMLNVFAHYCDWRTGLCRPGNERLQEESGLSESGTRYVRAQLESKGLIELWQPGQKNVGGRNHANVFRLCVEGEAFPPEDKPRSNKDGVSDETTNPAVGSVNPAVTPAKPRSETPETPKSDWPPSEDSSSNASSTAKPGKEQPPPAAYSQQLQELIQQEQSWLRIKAAEIKSGEGHRPLLDSDDWRDFKIECKAIGVPWQEIDRIWAELIRPFQTPVPAPQPQPKPGRAPEPKPHSAFVGTPNAAPASDKLLSLLTSAGSAGCSTVQLALELYGEATHSTGRVQMIVGRLRKKGHTIITQPVITKAGKEVRYVLSIPARPREPDARADHPDADHQKHRVH